MRLICDAFPEGIPDAVAPGGFDHRQEYPEDRGVRFELRDGGCEELREFELAKADQETQGRSGQQTGFFSA